jgi:hypothetical protein
MRGLGQRFGAGLLAVLFIGIALQPASAAKDTVLTKVYGEGHMTRVSPDGAWLASWVSQADGGFDLYIIDSKGTKQKADSAKLPGGMAWVPRSDKLFYCTATKGGPTDSNHVTYYTYDAKAKSKTRLQQFEDAKETYQFDPLAADDGSKVLHLTIDPSLHQLSFNVWFKDASGPGRVRGITRAANLDAFYDLSADGDTLYWWLKDPKNGCVNIIAFDMNRLSYLDAFEFPRAIDPAEAWTLFKVDAPNKQVAISTYSEKDPLLQLCIYNFKNPKKLYAKAIDMGVGEQVTYFDWKGFGGTLYAVVNYSATKEYGIEEIDAATGQRTPIYRGREAIDYVDYSPTAQSYYFSVVDNGGTSKAQTRFIRVASSK